MKTRALISATSGLVVTAGLIFVMQLLIATGEVIITEPRPRPVLDWVRPPEKPDPIVDEPEIHKIDKPPVPPPTSFQESVPGGSVGVALTAAPPSPRPRKAVLTGFGLSDGPLMNIFKVQPRYPAAAQARGLEGTVIVQFDVTAHGTVQNVVVVESSSRIFNKAAIEAASRFKYRPKVVDGTSVGVQGLQQLFRFDMEE